MVLRCLRCHCRRRPARRPSLRPLLRPSAVGLRGIGAGTEPGRGEAIEEEEEELGRARDDVWGVPVAGHGGYVGHGGRGVLRGGRQLYIARPPSTRGGAERDLLCALAGAHLRYGRPELQSRRTDGLLRGEAGAQGSGLRHYGRRPELQARQGGGGRRVRVRVPHAGARAVESRGRGARPAVGARPERRQVEEEEAGWAEAGVRGEVSPDCGQSGGRPRPSGL
mmetsp:Transcript_6758/g.24367  ORF Transcript_6758/g.24367 Transcript_6758/m.24367 type:complete len:223 (+) Transcript_6758:213-881(+)